MIGRAGGLLALAALALGCVGAAPPNEDRTLRLAVRADVTGFYPRPPMINEAYSLQINSNVFEGLVRFDQRLRLEPALTLRWENPDARTFVFELRPDARFSDGRPVTAQDVAASLEAARTRNWPTRDYLRAIDSVRVLGPNRLEIRTRWTDLILLHRLWTGFVIPAPSTAQADQTPAVGTGPYRLESWQPGRRFVLARNPLHPGPPPDFDRAEFEIVPDADLRLARVLEGRADVADHVPLDRIAALQRRAGVWVVAQPSLRVLFLGMRLDTAPFSDPRVREAIELAVDRDELVRLALDGQAQPAHEVVPRTVVGFDPQLAPSIPDRERARALLAEAGAAGLAIRLDGPNNRYVNDVRILEEVARQLRQVGLEVTATAHEKTAFFRMIGDRQSRLFLIGWSCESGDAGNVLDPVFHSRGRPLGLLNPLGIADAELDRLIDGANAASTMRERISLLRQAQGRIAVLRPVVPLVVQTETFLLSRRVAWQPAANFSLQVAAFQRVAPAAAR